MHYTVCLYKQGPCYIFKNCMYIRSLRGKICTTVRTYSTNVDKKNLLNWYSLSLSILSHQKGSTDAVPGMTAIKLILYAAYGSSTVLSRLERIHLLDILYNVHTVYTLVCSFQWVWGVSLLLSAVGSQISGKLLE